MTGPQLVLDYDGGLLDQFPEFLDVVRASVYDCGRAFKAIASDLDMSSSKLSRLLADNPSDPVHFPLHRLPQLLEATHDMRPVYWLCEQFLRDSSERQASDLARLREMMRQTEPILARLQTGRTP